MNISIRKSFEKDTLKLPVTVRLELAELIEQIKKQKLYLLYHLVKNLLVIKSHIASGGVITVLVSFFNHPQLN